MCHTPNLLSWSELTEHSNGRKKESRNDYIGLTNFYTFRDIFIIQRYEILFIKLEDIFKTKSKKNSLKTKLLNLTGPVKRTDNTAGSKDTGLPVH